MPSSPSLKSFFVTTAAIFVPLAVAVGVFSQWPGYGLADLAQGKTVPPEKSSSPTPPSSAPSMAAALDQEFQNLAERAMPSVVSVNTSKENVFMHVVLEKRQIVKELQGTEYVITPGVGSGVIVSKDGYILTCYHVIGDLDLENSRDFCSVTLHNEKEQREVDVVGVDKSKDLAVLKLRQPPPQNIEVLPFGDSDLMRRGNIVMAIGSPFGLFDTVSQGILSNCDRKLTDARETQPYFQTDCVINPGNSGGPLINLRGEIIGINWAIYSAPGEAHVWQGIGLVIRSNEAKAALDTMLNRSTPRGYLGLGIDETNFDPTVDERRVFVAEVSKDSPAESAGLQPQDIIEAIDGLPVANVTEAWKRIRQKAVGAELEFKVIRAPETTAITLKVTVADLDKNSPPPPEVVDFTKEMGLKLKNADSKERFTYKIRQWSHGEQFVIVTEVSPQSQLAGKVKPGDILYSLDGKTRLKSTEDVRPTLSARPATTPLTLAIWRDADKIIEFTVP